MATTVPNTFVNGTNADAPQVNANFAALATALDNAATAAGVPTPAVKQRGNSINAGTGTRTNTAYGAPNDAPDQVTGIVLPTNGLLIIAFQAVWQESVDNAARAAIFLGANQLKVGATNAAVPVVQEAANDMTVNTDAVLATGPGGLLGAGGSLAAAAYGGDVTTGQVIGNALYQATQGVTPTSGGAPIGGPVYIFLAAGTYTVSVQYKASSGTVTVKNRKLWVKAEAY